MKDIIASIKTIINSDHRVLVAMVALLLSAIAIVSISLANVHVSNLPIWSRYTSLGANYYDDQWQYLFVFVAEGIILGIIHNLIALKIYSKKGKQLTIMFICTSIFIALISAITLLRIIGINNVTL